MGITYCSQSDGVVTCATDQTLEAMFPEHWERGTGMWNVEHRFVKSRYKRGIPIPYVPIRDGTRSKCDGNDVPGTLFRNEGV